VSCSFIHVFAGWVSEQDRRKRRSLWFCDFLDARKDGSLPIVHEFHAELIAEDQAVLVLLKQLKCADRTLTLQTIEIQQDFASMKSSQLWGERCLFRRSFVMG